MGNYLQLERETLYAPRGERANQKRFARWLFGCRHSGDPYKQDLAHAAIGIFGDYSDQESLAIMESAGIILHAIDRRYGAFPYSHHFLMLLHIWGDRIEW